MNWADIARKAAKGESVGDTVPVGDGNSKLGTWATYRPVGPTCPEACPQVSACYALQGRVALAQRRASPDWIPAALGAARAAGAALRTGRPARLHVSGDLGQTWEDAADYIAALVELGAEFRRRFGVRWTGWLYTHLPRNEAIGEALRDAGWALRWSDDAGEWGAVVGDDETLTALRAAGVRYARCREQLDGTPCVACGLCWERPDLVIVFRGHGAKRRAVINFVPNWENWP